MPRILVEDGRREFPFPAMDSPRTSSSRSSIPSRSESSQSKSLRSSSSSASPRSLPRTCVTVERDSQESVIPSKLLSQIMPREHHGSRGLRTALAITTERLESETRRADDAERRVLEVLRKLRTAHEATMFAQAEASRAKEELTLFKYRFDDAQREILRAQELLNILEQEKLEAEAEAARARTTARRYREQQLIARAREEGRLEGFQEGLFRVKGLEFNEPRADDSRERRYAAPTVEDVPEEEDEEPRVPMYRRATPGLAQIRSRTPGPELRSRTPVPSTIPSGRVTPPTPPQQIRRPPSRPSTSRASMRTHVPDAAHYAPILPVPTIATPLNLPSPSHSRAGTPIGIPVPHPAPQSLDQGDIQAPIPIQEPIPSPVHPPIDIPPDGWIPYAGPNEEILLPPPHELSRPVSPTPPPPPILHSAEPPQPSTSTAPEPEPQTRPFNYLYAHDIPTEGIPVIRSNASRPMSPQSKASTSISQFDLVGAPKGKLRVSTWGRSTREDRQVMSPRGPRPREGLPVPVRPPMEERHQNRAAGRSGNNESPTSPLDRLFKKRYRNKSYKDSPPLPAIPDIVVESPSTPSTRRTSAKSAVTHPDLLSPEAAAQSLAPVAPAEDIVVMQTEIPGYHPVIPQFIPPRADSIPPNALIPPPGGQFPMGFVPLTPPMPLSSLSNNPVPVPSNTPVPIRSGTPVVIPPPINPIPVPSNTPVPIPPPGNPLPVPYKEATPIPHRSPLPISHRDPLPIPSEQPLPVPQRGSGSIGSPRQGRYDEAPIPAGVVYPVPPSRRSQTPVSGVLSPKRGRLEVRSPGENLSPLPLQFFFAPLRSETTTSEPS